MKWYAWVAIGAGPAEILLAVLALCFHISEILPTQLILVTIQFYALSLLVREYHNKTGRWI